MANEEQLSILKQGVEVWNKWREENPDEEINLSGADLRGLELFKANVGTDGIEYIYINFKDANLSWADLRGVNIFGGNFCGAHCHGTNFSNAHLVYANFSEAVLVFSKFIGASLFSVNLTGARLVHADFNSASLSGANIAGAILNGTDFNGADVSLLQYDRKKMTLKYLGVRGLDSCHGNPIFKRDAQDQDYIDAFQLKCTTFSAKVWFNIWKWFDFGRSIPRVALFGLFWILVFGAIYSIWPDLIVFNDTARTITPIAALYFSLSIFTTLGFGDITPCCLAGDILVAIEVILGYVTLGLLMAILANTVARRS